MKRTFALLLVAIMTAASVMAQHGMMGERDFNAPRPPHHEGMKAPDCDGHGKGMEKCMQAERHGAPMMKAVMRFADELGLTDAQKEKIKKAQFEHQMRAIDLRADLARAKLTTKALMHDENAVEAEVFQAIEKSAQAKAEMAKMKYMHRKEMGSILTDQQKAKLKELRKEKRAERFEKRKECFKHEGGEKKDFRGRRRGRG